MTITFPLEGEISRIEKYNINTGETTVYTGEHRNLITDDGLIAIHNGSKNIASTFEDLVVGDGSGTPSTSDSNMFSFVGRSDSENSWSTDSGYVIDETNDLYYIYIEGRWIFDAGTATGNLTEYGLTPSENNDTGVDTLCTHGLFKDNQGDPTTITVQDDESLRLFYTMRMYFDYQGNADSSGSFSLNGDNYNYSLGFTNVASDGLLGILSEEDRLSAIWTTNDGSGLFIEATSDNDLSISDLRFNDSPLKGDPSTYGTGNQFGKVEIDGENWFTVGLSVNPDNANFTNGIRWVGLGGAGTTSGSGEYPIYLKFDPAIPKTDTEEFDVTVRYRYGRK